MKQKENYKILKVKISNIMILFSKFDYYKITKNQILKKIIFSFYKFKIIFI
jgi:hypothetical protein